MRWKTKKTKFVDRERDITMGLSLSIIKPTKVTGLQLKWVFLSSCTVAEYKSLRKPAILFGQSLSKSSVNQPIHNSTNTSTRCAASRTINHPHLTFTLLIHIRNTTMSSDPRRRGRSRWSMPLMVRNLTESTLSMKRSIAQMADDKMRSTSLEEASPK